MTDYRKLLMQCYDNKNDWDAVDSLVADSMRDTWGELNDVFDEGVEWVWATFRHNSPFDGCHWETEFWLIRRWEEETEWVTRYITVVPIYTNIGIPYDLFPAFYEKRKGQGRPFFYGLDCVEDRTMDSWYFIPANEVHDPEFPQYTTRFRHDYNAWIAFDELAICTYYWRDIHGVLRTDCPSIKHGFGDNGGWE